MKEKLWNPPNLYSWEAPLIQERYFPDRWKMLVCCILLNLTNIKQVRPMIDDLFELAPDPLSMIEADEDTLINLLRPLGLAEKRCKTLKKFSTQFLNSDWSKAKELYGIGKYGDDSDQIFYLGNWKSVVPKDGALIRYLEYLVKHYDQEQYNMK